MRYLSFSSGNIFSISWESDPPAHYAPFNNFSTAISTGFLIISPEILSCLSFEGYTSPILILPDKIFVLKLHNRLISSWGRPLSLIVSVSMNSATR